LTPAANTGDAAGDTYTSIEGLVGSNFNDVLRIANGGGSIWALDGNDSAIGGTGNDDLHGQSGIDHLIGGAGADILDGGAGFDFANYSTATSAVTANLLNPGTNTGDAAGDGYVSIEGLVGSNLSDVLQIANGGGSIWALDGNDSLVGGSGNDDLHGQNGIDTLNGAAGADVLEGGAANDTFMFALGQAIGDTLLDFNGNGANPGDQIQFTGYGTAAQGATFTQTVAQIGTSQWTIHAFDNSVNDVITLSNGAAVDPTDFIFL
jgi:Ca2+-binding RTX toxin-like protein